MCCSNVFNLIIISSKYAIIAMFSSEALNLSIIRWNVACAFRRPNGIFLNWYIPNGVTKVFFSLCASHTSTCQYLEQRSMEDINFDLFASWGHQFSAECIGQGLFLHSISYSQYKRDYFHPSWESTGDVHGDLLTSAYYIPLSLLRLVFVMLIYTGALSDYLHCIAFFKLVQNPVFNFWSHRSRHRCFVRLK